MGLSSSVLPGGVEILATLLDESRPRVEEQEGFGSGQDYSQHGSMGEL